MESSGNFPEGIRILAVDGDGAKLKNLKSILEKCKYKANEAVAMLGEKNEKYGFDLVMSDVNMTDMDGFQFLRHVAFELNTPVIMMSKDGERSKVMKGVRCGACEHLLKPIEFEDVQYIWTHVFRKSILLIGRGEECSFTPEMGEDGLIIGMKRKELAESSNRGGKGGVGSSETIKKPRMKWTKEYDEKFVKAIKQSGDKEKVGPKKILELMGEPSITRAQVASHLQKYRKQQNGTRHGGTSTQESRANSYPEQQQPPGLLSGSLPQGMMNKENYGYNHSQIESQFEQPHLGDFTVIPEYVPVVGDPTEKNGDLIATHVGVPPLSSQCHLNQHQVNFPLPDTDTFGSSTIVGDPNTSTIVPPHDPFAFVDSLEDYQYLRNEHDSFWP